MKGSFPLFVALNPIKTLIRVMHRNFTPQVCFFWVLLEGSVGLRSENVLCSGESLNPFGEKLIFSVIPKAKSEDILKLCRLVAQVVTIIKAQGFACPPPHNSLHLILQFFPSISCRVSYLGH